MDLYKLEQQHNLGLHCQAAVEAMAAELEVRHCLVGKHGHTPVVQCHFDYHWHGAGSECRKRLDTVQSSAPQQSDMLGSK